MYARLEYRSVFVGYIFGLLYIRVSGVEVRDGLGFRVGLFGEVEEVEDGVYRRC